MVAVPTRPAAPRIRRQPGKLRPHLGLVVTWPVAGTGNRFLVAYWDDGPYAGIRMAWLKRQQLAPIKVDPNWLDGPAPWKTEKDILRYLGN